MLAYTTERIVAVEKAVPLFGEDTLNNYWVRE
jgi:hypothetical protein